MTISARIEKDSISPNGDRITTFVLTYPRFIHSEFMTHRMFSRNASSSRAIPFEKQVQMILDDTAMPISFSKNKKGMQANEDIDDQEEAKRVWLEARDKAIEEATKLHRLGVHKQHVNRLLEPFMHITVVCTATEYNNFFALRYHSMAQPELQELARQMWKLYRSHKPRPTREGEWHLPFIKREDIIKIRKALDLRAIEINSEYPKIIEPLYTILSKLSVARCARVSYLNHDGTAPTLEQDLELYERLVGGSPKHSSPAEHQATPLQGIWSGNFFGWKQYRKTLIDECIYEFEGPLG